MQRSDQDIQPKEYLKTYNNLSLSKEYFYFSAIVFVIIISVLIWLLWFVYNNLEENKERNYAQEAERIQEVLEDSFIYTSNFMKFIGSRVASTTNGEPELVASILQTKIDVNKLKDDIFPWTVFKFIDRNNNVVATTFGIVQPPISAVSDKRPWLKTAQIQPWTLHISEPSLGSSSGEYIIPGGYGITDKNGNFLGILSTGFSIKKIKRKIERSLRSDTDKFMIFTEDYKFIMSSEDNNEGSYDALIRELKISKILLKNYGKFAEGFEHGGVIYYGYYKIPRPYNYIILVGQNKQYLQQEFKQLVTPEIVRTLVLGGCFLVLLYFFRKKIVNPMILLSERAKLISQGNLNINLPTVNSKEAAYLVDALEMVKTAFQRENAVRAELSEANKQIKLTNLDLEQRTKELQKALTWKTDFLNNISHEIRTPIQGVTGISEGLVDHWHSISDERKFEISKHIVKSARRLLSLVGNLLDLSKFTAGKMLLSFQTVNFNQLVKNMIEECNILYINDRHINLDFVSKHNIFAMIDYERIMQVLRNLFVNAIKFSSDNSAIIIHTSITEIADNENKKIEALHFSISNKGVGIPENEIETIFSPFAQSTHTKSKSGGTGLGLAICREIINGHHGEIWAENNKTGGATFHFVIPIVQGKQKNISYRIAKHTVEVLDDKPIISKPATILIIDDEESCILSVELILHGSNYKLVKAESGSTGLSYLQLHAKKVDLILLDLLMPDMHGLDVLAEIKKQPNLAHIKIILQSGIIDEEALQKAYDFGIDGHIKKPYQKNAILAEIAKVLAPTKKKKR